MIKSVILVAIGGGIGSVARYLLSVFVLSKTTGSSFPWGTFVVNILGCFVIGLLYGIADKVALLSAEWRLFLAVGICGGFTTFSTFSHEAFVLIRNGQFYSTFFYIGLSVFLGVLAVFIGYKIIFSLLH